MGLLDFEDDKRLLKRIKRVLKRRNLIIDLDEGWEVHGPHQEMNYKVFIGYAYREANENAKCICPSKSVQIKYCEAHRRCYCVAIYPRAVYEISEPSEWAADANPENRISIE